MFDPRQFVESELHYLRTMNEGMAGMVHATDVAVAERHARHRAARRPGQARAEWDRALNDAVTSWHRARGADMPDLNELEANGLNEPMVYAFPHCFVLPMYSSASSYRFRPLGPEETLMEIWSLTRFPEGDEPEPPTRPDVWAPTTRGPADPDPGLLQPAPSAARAAHRGVRVHAAGRQTEGHIGNFHRTIDGFLSGLPTRRCSRRCASQPQPARPAGRRPRPLTR